MNTFLVLTFINIFINQNLISSVGNPKLDLASRLITKIQETKDPANLKKLDVLIKKCATDETLSKTARSELLTAYACSIKELNKEEAAKEEAANILRESIAIKSNPRSLLELGRICLSQCKLGEAETSFKLLSEHPESDVIQKSLGFYCLSRSTFFERSIAERIEYMNKSLEGMPKSILRNNLLEEILFLMTSSKDERFLAADIKKILREVQENKDLMGKESINFLEILFNNNKYRDKKPNPQRAAEKLSALLKENPNFCKELFNYYKEDILDSNSTNMLFPLLKNHLEFCLSCERIPEEYRSISKSILALGDINDWWGQNSHTKAKRTIELLLSEESDSLEEVSPISKALKETILADYKFFEEAKDKNPKFGDYHNELLRINKSLVLNKKNTEENFFIKIIKGPDSLLKSKICELLVQLPKLEKYVTKKNK